MKVLRTLDRWIALAEGALIVVLLSLMVGGSFIQVLLRNLFHTGIDGADPLLRHGVLWLALLGASLATRESRHIRIDIFPRLVPRPYRKSVEGLTSLAACAVAAALAGASWELVMLERSAGSVLVLGLPTWAAQLILPIGFSLIAFRFILQAVDNLLRADGPPEETR